LIEKLKRKNISDQSYRPHLDVECGRRLDLRSFESHFNDSHFNCVSVFFFAFISALLTNLQPILSVSKALYDMALRQIVGVSLSRIFDLNLG